jgi:hypothetical protein
MQSSISEMWQVPRASVQQSTERDQHVGGRPRTTDLIQPISPEPTARGLFQQLRSLLSRCAIAPTSH